MSSGRRWHIVHSEASSGWGGQERRVMAELAGFRARGSRVALIADTGSEIYRRASAQGFEVFPCSPMRYRYPREFVRVRRWLRETRPDIVNTHSSRDGWLVGMAARAAGVPFVIRSRHFDVPPKTVWLSRIVYARLADHVITTSTRISGGLSRQFGLPSGRFTALPTGVDLGVFHPHGPRTDLRAGRIPGDVPLIGTVSVLRQAKGHRHLIDAMKRVLDSGRRVHCFIVGEGGMRAEIEKQIAALGMEEHITLTGNREDVPDILRALDLLVLPSVHEAVPQAACQALACGLPVVGSDVGGIPEVVRDGVTGRLVPPADPVALAGAIVAMLAAPEDAVRMARAGTELVRRNHSMDAMLDRLDALYAAHLP
jgi:glycosyltransferase involved in cell wall biosynthesis